MKHLFALLIVLASVPLTASPQVTPAGRDARPVLPAPDLTPFAIERDVPYAQTGNPRHRLDIYRPKARADAALPVIVCVHGGGWVQGSKADCARMIAQLIRSGRYAAVAVGYRLADEAQWPAQIHDVNASIRWVRAHASKYGFDADRIGVWGASAGGHLALLLAVTSEVDELDGEIGEHPNLSRRVAAVANFFGITDLRTLDDRREEGIGMSAHERLLGGSVRERAAAAAAASPITYVSAKSAPVLTIHGTSDSIVPYEQAIALDAALREAGGASYFVTVEGGGHGDFAFAANDRVDAFFAKYLLGEAVEIDTTPVTSWQR